MSIIDKLLQGVEEMSELGFLGLEDDKIIHSWTILKSKNHKNPNSDNLKELKIKLWPI